MPLLEQIYNWIFPCEFDPNYLDSLPSPSHTIPHCFSRYAYDSQKTRKLIRYLKRYRNPRLIKNLAYEMKSCIEEYLEEQYEVGFFHNPLIISVPMSKKRRVQRGFNQSELLAKALLSYISHASYKGDVVIKIKETAKQAFIKDRQERFLNISGSFALLFQEKVQDKDIIIVDDLITTGATVSEIKKILEIAGARTIIILTLAH